MPSHKQQEDEATGVPPKTLRARSAALWRADRATRDRTAALHSAALLATIPAFYLALTATLPALATGLYLAAAALSVHAAWAGAAEPRRGVHAPAPHRVLGLLMALSLLLAALLPPGDDADVLAVRLGAAALVALRLSEAVLPPAWHRGLPRLLGFGIGLFGVCGLGFWWLEPRAASFGDGLWLAFTTAATVGYGDIVPSTPAAKIFSVFVVLMGLAVLSLVTASLAAFWVQGEERRIERELMVALHRELRAVRDEIAALRADGPIAAVSGSAAPADCSAPAPRSPPNP